MIKQFYLEKKIKKNLSLKDINEISYYFKSRSKTNNKLFYLIKTILINKKKKLLSKNKLLKKKINYEISNLDYQILCFQDWIVLSNIFLVCGFFSESYKIRMLSYKKFEKTSMKFMYLKQYLFFQIFIKKQKQSKYRKFMFSFFLIFMKFYNFKNFFEYDFRKLVKGKTIAIIGPGDNIKNIKNLSKFDLFVYLSYFGKKKNSTKSPVDISYLNGDDVDKVNRNKRYYEDLKKSKIKFLCIKKNSQKRLFDNQRVYANKNFFYSGTPNGLQFVILDLILSGVKKIKLFNFNFYLDKKVYYTNYSNFKNKNFNSIKEMWLYSFTIHDYYSNYIFIKYLYKNKIVKVDKTLKKILEFSNINFNNRFYKFYRLF
jgi:hypothetical protein